MGASVAELLSVPLSEPLPLLELEPPSVAAIPGTQTLAVVVIGNPAGNAPHTSPAVAHSAAVVQSWKLVAPAGQAVMHELLIVIEPPENPPDPQQTSPAVVQSVLLMHIRFVVMPASAVPLDEPLLVPLDDPPLDELLPPSSFVLLLPPPLVLELQAAASVPAIETATKIIILFILTNLPGRRDCPRDGAELSSLLCHAHK